MRVCQFRHGRLAVPQGLAIINYSKTDVNSQKERGPHFADLSSFSSRALEFASGPEEDQGSGQCHEAEAHDCRQTTLAGGWDRVLFSLNGFGNG